jgi:hypothetical protein
MCEHGAATQERGGAQHLQIAGSLGATAARALHHRAAIRRGYRVVGVGAEPQQHSHLQSFRTHTRRRTVSSRCLTVIHAQSSAVTVANAPKDPLVLPARCPGHGAAEAFLRHGTMSLPPCRCCLCWQQWYRGYITCSRAEDKEHRIQNMPPTEQIIHVRRRIHATYRTCYLQSRAYITGLRAEHTYHATEHPQHTHPRSQLPRLPGMVRNM